MWWGEREVKGEGEKKNRENRTPWRVIDHHHLPAPPTNQPTTLPSPRLPFSHRFLSSLTYSIHYFPLTFSTRCARRVKKDRVKFYSWCCVGGSWVVVEEMMVVMLVVVEVMLAVGTWRLDCCLGTRTHHTSRHHTHNQPTPGQKTREPSVAQSSLERAKITTRAGRSKPRRW